MKSATRARMRAPLIAALALLVGVAVAGPAMAQGGGGAATVEVRVWQSVDDDRDLYVSARPAGGSWRTLGTVPLALDGLTASGGYRYGDVALALPGAGGDTAEVQLRVWQNVDEGWRFFLNARPAGGSWSGTRSLLPDDGLSASGRYRYGDIALALRPQVTTLAGRAGKYGYADGPAGVALLGQYPNHVGPGLTFDDAGNVIVADWQNGAIRRIAPDGTVTTIAGGNGLGVRDGPVTSARFAGPTDVAIAADGSIYVADSFGHRIRRIGTNGMVTTVAGGGPIYGYPYEEGAWGSFRDGPGAEARLPFPDGIAFLPDGDLLIIDSSWCVRRLSPEGRVSPFAGSSSSGQCEGSHRSSIVFEQLLAIDVDAEGNVYLIDWAYDDSGIAIKKIDTHGAVSTIFHSIHPGEGGVLAIPLGLAVKDNGAIYIANTGRHQILELRDGELRGVAGTGDEGHADGDRDEATFSSPSTLAIAVDGAMVVADTGTNLIRRIAPPTDRAGTNSPTLAVAEKIAWLPDVKLELFAGQAGSADGFADGPVEIAYFYRPWGMALDASGNVIVADSGNHAIRQISPDGMVTTIAGGNGKGVRDGPGALAQFAEPRDVAVHADGSIYVADSLGNRIRRVAPDGTVSTVSGGGPVDERSRSWRVFGGVNDGPAAEARFSDPTAIAFDHDGNLLIVDRGNDAIRVLSPEGQVSTLASAELASLPRGIAVDENGAILFTEANAIRAVDSRGIVSTMVQTPGLGHGGALSVYLSGISAGEGGTLYVADPGANRLARVTRDGSIAIISLAAIAERGASANVPDFMTVLVAGDGSLLVSDISQNAIWKITFDGE